MLGVHSPTDKSISRQFIRKFSISRPTRSKNSTVATSDPGNWEILISRMLPHFVQKKDNYYLAY